MTIKYSDRYINVDAPDQSRRHIISTDPLELSQIVAIDRDCLVEADVVLVSRNILLGSKNLEIRCRELRAIDEVDIRSVGQEGVPTFPAGTPRLDQSRQSPGDDGLDGVDGGPGGNAGNISITCWAAVGRLIVSSQGGQGGRGQDGGDGITGRTGADGPKRVYRRDEPRPPRAAYSGGLGGNGGRPGLPGKNGPGGNPGSVQLHIRDLTSFIGVIQSIPGEFGVNANVGKPGGRGVGGIPGQLYYLKTGVVDARVAAIDNESGNIDSTAEEEDSALALIATLYGPISEMKRIAGLGGGGIGGGGSEEIFVENGDRGNDGEPGPSRLDELTGLQLYRPVTAELQKPTQVEPRVIGSGFSESFLSLQLESMEDEFRVLGAKPDPIFWGKIESYLLMCSDRPAIYSRLCAMLQKSLLGLDFFGYSIDCAPLLSMNIYKELIDISILPIATFLDTQFQEFIKEQKSEDERISVLIGVKAKAQAHLVALQVQSRDIEESTRSQLDAIPAMNQAILDALEALKLATKNLKDAFNRMGQCDVLQTLETVAVVVAAAYATGGASLAATGSWSKFIDTWNDNNSSASTLWDARNLLADGLKKVGGDVKDVASSIEAIRKGYASLEDSKRSRQAPALVMDRSEFDKVAAKYADLSEAQAYKAAGYAYLDRIDSRNQAIIEYNAKLLRLVEIEHQLRSARDLVSGAESAISGSLDVSAPIVYTRLRALRRSVLDGAAALIHAQSKAMGYLFAEYVSPSVSSRDATELGAAHTAVLFSWTKAKELYRPVKRLMPGSVAVPLRRFATQEAWKRFISIQAVERPLPLNINLRSIGEGDLLKTARALRVTGASITLKGVSLAAGEYVPWTMFQDGRETLLKGPTESISFSRTPTRLSGYVAKAPIDDPDMSEGGLYSGVSLLSTWILVLVDAKRLIDYKNCDDILLNINGYYLG